MGLDLEDMILVVDEAHNLPDRIRRGFERTITMKVIRDAITEIEGIKKPRKKKVEPLTEKNLMLMIRN